MADLVQLAQIRAQGDSKLLKKAIKDLYKLASGVQGDELYVVVSPVVDRLVDWVFRLNTEESRGDGQQVDPSPVGKAIQPRPPAPSSTDNPETK